MYRIRAKISQRYVSNKRSLDRKIEVSGGGKQVSQEWRDFTRRGMMGYIVCSSNQAYYVSEGPIFYMTSIIPFTSTFIS